MCDINRLQTVVSQYESDVVQNHDEYENRTYGQLDEVALTPSGKSYWLGLGHLQLGDAQRAHEWFESSIDGWQWQYETGVEALDTDALSNAWKIPWKELQRSLSAAVLSGNESTARTAAEYVQAELRTELLQQYTVPQRQQIAALSALVQQHSLTADSLDQFEASIRNLDQGQQRKLYLAQLQAMRGIHTRDTTEATAGIRTHLHLHEAYTVDHEDVHITEQCVDVVATTLAVIAHWNDVVINLETEYLRTETIVS